MSGCRSKLSGIYEVVRGRLEYGVVAYTLSGRARASGPFFGFCFSGSGLRRQLVRTCGRSE